MIYFFQQNLKQKRVIIMVFTYNYYDLQNIKEQLKQEKVKNTKKIYLFIESYQETLNFMYEKDLVKNLSKQDLEDDLQDFARSLLQNTDLSYKQLELLYNKNIFKKNSEIKLKI